MVDVERFDTKPVVGYCSFSFSREGRWLVHSHGEHQPCPLRPHEIHWQASDHEEGR